MKATFRVSVLATITALIWPALTASAHAGAAPTCEGQPATIVGTEGPDRLTGTPGKDVAVALGGNVLDGRGGADTIRGGPDRCQNGQTLTNCERLR